VIRKVRTLGSIKAPVELGHRKAIGGNNHHMVVVHPRQGGKVLCRTVSAWELARRPRARGSSLISREAPEGYEFAYSIARKESFVVRHPHSGEDVVVVAQKLAGSSSFGSGCDLYLRDARDARPATEGNKDPLYRLSSASKLAEAIVTKLQVDPLGRATPAHS
jgi:hypothetical protein